MSRPNNELKQCRAHALLTRVCVSRLTHAHRPTHSPPYTAQYIHLPRLLSVNLLLFLLLLLGKGDGLQLCCNCNTIEESRMKQTSARAFVFTIHYIISVSNLLTVKLLWTFKNLSSSQMFERVNTFQSPYSKIKYLFFFIINGVYTTN